MIEYLPDNILHNICSYISYSDIFMSLKYCNMQLKYNIISNIKIQRRYYMLYYNILKQQIYHKTKHSNYNFSQNISYENYCNKIFHLIDFNKLSNKQAFLVKSLFNSIQKSFT